MLRLALLGVAQIIFLWHTRSVPLSILDTNHQKVFNKENQIKYFQFNFLMKTLVTVLCWVVIIVLQFGQKKSYIIIEVIQIIWQQNL